MPANRAGQYEEWSDLVSTRTWRQPRAEQGTLKVGQLRARQVLLADFEWKMGGFRRMGRRGAGTQFPLSVAMSPLTPPTVKNPTIGRVLSTPGAGGGLGEGRTEGMETE